MTSEVTSHSEVSLREGGTLAVFVIGVLFVLGTGLSWALDAPLARSLPAILALFILILRSAVMGWSVRMPAQAIPAFGFFVLMVVGLLYTKTPMYGLWKTGMFGLFWLALPVALFGLLDRWSSLFAFAGGLALGGALYCLLLLATVGEPFSILVHADKFYRFSLDAQNPIYLGRTLGTTMLALAWVATEATFGWRRALAFLVFPVLGAFLATTASKGPLFGFLASALVFGLVARGKAASLIVIALVVILLVTVAAPYGTILNGATSDARVVRTVRLSVHQRMASWSSALHGFAAEAPAGMLFGAGTGGFAYLDRREDVRHYPHNILLEALYENGVVGVTLLICLLVLPALAVRRIASVAWQEPRMRRMVALGCSLYVFAVVNAQVTGDLSSNEWLPTAAVLLLASSRAAALCGGEQVEARAVAPGSS